LAVKGTVAYRTGSTIQDVACTSKWENVCILSKNETLLYRLDTGEDFGGSKGLRYTHVGSFARSTAILLAADSEILMAHEDRLTTLDLQQVDKQERYILPIGLSGEAESGNISMLGPLDLDSVFVVDRQSPAFRFHVLMKHRERHGGQAKITRRIARSPFYR